MSKKYIMFHKAQKGQDGYKYIGGVKYRIMNEDGNTVYLCSPSSSRVKRLNKFSKKKIEGIAKIGNIIMDA